MVSGDVTLMAQAPYGNKCDVTKDNFCEEIE
jgi:hypothetical protein